MPHEVIPDARKEVAFFDSADGNEELGKVGEELPEHGILITINILGFSDSDLASWFDDQQFDFFMQNIDWILTRIVIVNIGWILIGYWLSNHVKSSSNSSLEWQFCTWKGNLKLWLNYIYLASSTSNSFNHWIPFLLQHLHLKIHHELQHLQHSFFDYGFPNVSFTWYISKYFVDFISHFCVPAKTKVFSTCPISTCWIWSAAFFCVFIFSVPISSLNFICCFSLCMINSDISKAHISIFSLNCNLQVQK